MRLAAITCALSAAILLALADRLDPAAHSNAARVCTSAAAIAALAAIVFGIVVVRQRRHKRS